MKDINLRMTVPLTNRAFVQDGGLRNIPYDFNDNEKVHVKKGTSRGKQPLSSCYCGHSDAGADTRAQRTDQPASPPLSVQITTPATIGIQISGILAYFNLGKNAFAKGAVAQRVPLQASSPRLLYAIDLCDAWAGYAR